MNYWVAAYLVIGAILSYRWYNLAFDDILDGSKFIKKNDWVNFFVMIIFMIFWLPITIIINIEDFIEKSDKSI